MPSAISSSIRSTPSTLTRSLAACRITLADGRRFERRAENGMLGPGELPDKFLRLTRAALGEHGAATLYERLQQLEGEQSLDWLR